MDWFSIKSTLEYVYYLDIILDDRELYDTNEAVDFFLSKMFLNILK